MNEEWNTLYQPHQTEHCAAVKQTKKKMQGWTFQVLSSDRACILAPALPLASHLDLISDVSVPVFVPFSIHSMPVPQGLGARCSHTSPRMVPWLSQLGRTLKSTHKHLP